MRNRSIPKHILPACLAALTLAAPAGADPGADQSPLAREILGDPNLREVRQMARKLLQTGLTAGTSYGEVWIRDLNAFIEVALAVNEPSRFRESLQTFFKFQGPNGDIVDVYIPKDRANVKDKYRSSPLAPTLLAHKNTVETDQESSLVQAIHKYVSVTGDCGILDETIAGRTVRERLAAAVDYVRQERFDPAHGLVWGATTADWGNVQPEHSWGVELDESSHRAIDIYDNAMFVIAIENYLQLVGEDSPAAARWKSVRDDLKRKVRKHLWDAKKQKFIAHVYLAGPPLSQGLRRKRGLLPRRDRGGHRGGSAYAGGNHPLAGANAGKRPCSRGGLDWADALSNLSQGGVQESKHGPVRLPEWW